MLPESPSRRRFLETAAAIPIAAGRWCRRGPGPDGSAPQGAAPPRRTAKRAVLISMLPAGPFADRFAIAKAAGFEAIEMQTLTDAAEVEAARAASPPPVSRSTR